MFCKPSSQSHHEVHWRVFLPYWHFDQILWCMTYLFPWAWVSFIFKRLREFLWCFDNNRFLLSYSRTSQEFVYINILTRLRSDYDKTLFLAAQVSFICKRLREFPANCVLQRYKGYIYFIGIYCQCGHNTTTGPPGLSHCNKVASLEATPVWTTTESPTDSVV